MEGTWCSRSSAHANSMKPAPVFMPLRSPPLSCSSTGMGSFIGNVPCGLIALSCAAHLCKLLKSQKMVHFFPTHRHIIIVHQCQVDKVWEPHSLVNQNTIVIDNKHVLILVINVLDLKMKTYSSVFLKPKLLPNLKGLRDSNVFHSRDPVVTLVGSTSGELGQSWSRVLGGYLAYSWGRLWALFTSGCLLGGAMSIRWFIRSRTVCLCVGLCVIKHTQQAVLRDMRLAFLRPIFYLLFVYV